MAGEKLHLIMNFSHPAFFFLPPDPSISFLMFLTCPTTGAAFFISIQSLAAKIVSADIQPFQLVFLRSAVQTVLTFAGVCASCHSCARLIALSLSLSLTRSRTPLIVFVNIHAVFLW